MTQLNKNLQIDVRPVADPKNIIKGNGYRITVLTERLLRIEIGPEDAFCDKPTQSVWYRDFAPVDFTTEKANGLLVIKTKRSEFHFNESSKKLVFVKVDKKALCVKNQGNLKGTYRTLDGKNGAVKLGDGIISTTGIAYYEDKTLIITEDGAVAQRPAEKDIYVFAYGHEYRDALTDFYRLCGSVPMLPRFVFGNWWSRYRAYTQKEYMDVMDRFEKEKIPLTVATIDMDWHWNFGLKERFGDKMTKEDVGTWSGWTGYSWNTELFPDYRKFLSDLKKKNLRITLNLHPADGLRAFEDSYEEMAKAMGVDPKTKKTIKFDLSDNKFINNYFDIMHHGYEKEGVDFWWIDWQQGVRSTVAGLDPLWALNHYHYLDNSRDRRGVILSRYAGIGSHRYPLGFSGDSIITWKSLDFQPYMTSTATNVGYVWWSHDIGGHNFGYFNDEIYLRWCQYGVFSPINRLHSTNHDLQGKEPWKHSETVRRITSDYLRLRHRLIPYIYSAMKSATFDSRALCEPMYYTYPEEENAYKVKNEYFFGTEMIVIPVTSPKSDYTNLSATEAWIPDGRYTDVFTGRVYNGNKKLTLFRDLEYIPVLAKAGAIIPLSLDEGNSSDNPEKMEVLVFRGNNTYTLYEDDGLTDGYKDGAYANTRFTVKENGNTLTFKIDKPVYGAEGKFALPENRTFKVTFKDVVDGIVKVNGKEVKLDDVVIKAGDEVTVENVIALDNGDKMEEARVVIGRIQATNTNKVVKYKGMKEIKDEKEFLAMTKKRFKKEVYLAVKEVLTADE